MWTGRAREMLGAAGVPRTRCTVATLAKQRSKQIKSNLTSSLFEKLDYKICKFSKLVAYVTTSRA